MDEDSSDPDEAGDDGVASIILGLADFPAPVAVLIESYAAPYFDGLLGRLNALLPPGTDVRFDRLTETERGYELVTSGAAAVDLTVHIERFSAEISIALPLSLLLLGVRRSYILPAGIRQVRLIVKRETPKTRDVLEHTATPQGAIIPRFRPVPVIETALDALIEL
jgi:hypothetical protein